jgi:hypothetical protein
LVVWHVAHCCLKSVAPSGGFAGGGVNCALAILATSIALQDASPIGSAARRFFMAITVCVARL